MCAEAAKFAMTSKDDTVWNVMSSGAAWEVSYSDAFCFFSGDADRTLCSDSFW